MTLLQKNRRRASEQLAELFGEFEVGARLSVNNIVYRYFNPKNRSEYILGEYKVRSWLRSLKSKFQRKGLYFGNIDEFGNYGICLDREDYAYVFELLHRQVKGVVQTAVQLKKEATQKGLLPEGTPVRLLSFEIRKEKENE